MADCDAQRMVMSDRKHPIVNVESEASLILSLNDVYRNPPDVLKNRPCGVAYAEGALAGHLKAVRNKGEEFSEAVFNSIGKVNPSLAASLRTAVVSQDGHIEFK